MIAFLVVATIIYLFADFEFYPLLNFNIHVLRSTVLLVGLYCVILYVITGIHYRIDAAESAANVFGCIDKIFLENSARKKDKVIFV